MRLFIATAIVSLAAAMFAVPAGAQTTTSVEVDVTGSHSPYCGAWQNGTWVPNGNCVSEAAPTVTVNTNSQPMTTGDRVTPSGRVWERLRGTIIGVNGHQVTLQQSARTLVINDSPALSREDTGRVATGREVTIHGYWEAGVFYATRFE